MMQRPFARRFENIDRQRPNDALASYHHYIAKRYIHSIIEMYFNLNVLQHLSRTE